jgi:hypothetical protein
MRDRSFLQRKRLCWILLCFIGVLPLAASQENENQKTCSADGTCQNTAVREPAKVIETIPIEYGEPQVILDHDSEITRAHLQQTQRYIMAHASWKQTCLNRHHLCSFWAATGECAKNELYMVKHCTPSCQKCTIPESEGPKQVKASSDTTTTTTVQEESGILVATAFGEAQLVPTVNADPVVQTIAKSTTYMNRVFTEEQYASVRQECKCQHSSCSLWASQGESK